MPPAPKKKLDGEVDNVKRAKIRTDRKPGERVKVPVRKPRPECQAQPIIGKDEAYTLPVAHKIGGSSGTYLVEMEEGQVEFCAKRFSDYDLSRKNKEGKFFGRRPRPAKDFAKFQDIINELKGKNEKWVDQDAPQRKDGYKEEDMIKDPFVYRQAKEVWPRAKV